VIAGTIHLLIGTVDLKVLALLVRSIPGIIMDARLSRIVPEQLIRPLLATVLLFSGGKSIW
tara:strand:- start:543 stop:725 length:183 start_codon:yes stop_codon:yes gene_type:complete